MEVLNEFFERFCGDRQKKSFSLEASALVNQGPDLSQYVTFGAHLYRRQGEVAEVIFTHKAKQITRTIIDNDGNICDFPGFKKLSEILEHLEGGKLPEPVVRFRTEFERESDGRFLMIWEIQPDGRYWEDEDGFGATSDAEVRLYSHIDESGRFTEPFGLYSVGTEEFYHK